MKKNLLLLSVVFFLFLNLKITSQIIPTQGQIIFLKIKNTNDVGFGKNTKLNKHLDIVINGPLVGLDGMFLGGSVDNGELKKEWVNPNDYKGNFSIGNGIFGVKKNGTPFLFKYEDRDKIIISETKWAFQNGLILVKDGFNVRGSSSSKYCRSGIGYKENGNLIIIVSTKRINLKEFANLFIFEGCTNAIYLDGGPYVFLKTEDLTTGLDRKNILKLQFFHQY